MSFTSQIERIRRNSAAASWWYHGTKQESNVWYWQWRSKWHSW
jgi:hypothetical protein